VLIIKLLVAFISILFGRSLPAVLAVLALASLDTAPVLHSYLEMVLELDRKLNCDFKGHTSIFAILSFYCF